MNEPQKDKRRTTYRLLRLLLGGKLLQSSVPEKRLGLFEEAGITRNAVRLIRELETDGTIVGYVPVLSEKGMETFRALRTLYEVAPTEGADADSP